MNSKFLFIFIILFFFSCKIYAGENAQQALNTNLPQIMSISEIIVDTVPYPIDSHLSGVDIIGTAPASPNVNMIWLTPLHVRVHTNSATPITVTAVFQELKHLAGSYSFSSSSLSISPNSYTINTPYDNFVTDPFTPYIRVTPAAVKGNYSGKLLFTLGGV